MLSDKFMDLRQLRYFQAVAEELSFSRAARRLHIAQPALSRTVKELEEQLGVRLLERDRRTVRITPGGSVLLSETGVLLERLEETARRVRRAASGEEGELRLGYIGPPTQAFLGRLLKEFRRRHPRVTILLEERTPERVCEMVARGKLNLGLTRPVASEQALGLTSRLLRREPLWAALPREHPLAGQRALRWRQLDQQPLIVLSRREGVSLHDAILGACRTAGFSPSLGHTPSVINTVLAYVEAGAGLGVIPDSVAALGHGRGLEFRPLVPRRFADLVMVWAVDHATPVAEVFRDLILEKLRAGQLWT